MQFTSKKCWNLSAIVDLFHKIIAAICILQQLCIVARYLEYKIHNEKKKIHKLCAELKCLLF